MFPNNKIVKYRQPVTKSEALFEKILTDKKIQFRRIPEGTSKTPDYEINLDGELSYFEVKELAENEYEKETLTNITSGTHNVINVNSQRVNNSIKAACNQFKSYKVTNSPCIVVLHDARDFFVKDLLFTDCIQSAMLGTAEFMENEEGKLIEFKRNHGLLTNNRKTYISAIAMLYEGSQDLIFLHNPNAVKPIINIKKLARFQNHYQAVKTGAGLIWQQIQQKP